MGGEEDQLVMILLLLFLPVVTTQSLPRKTRRIRRRLRASLLCRLQRLTQLLVRSRESSSRSSLRTQILVRRLRKMSKSQASGMLDLQSNERIVLALFLIAVLPSLARMSYLTPSCSFQVSQKILSPACGT